MFSVIVAVLISSRVSAAGISADAGLTPPEDRWILRTQVRSMLRSGGSMTGKKMATLLYPVMVAYGLRHDWMIMARQALVHRELTSAAGKTGKTGLGDLFILTKYLAYRVNSRIHTFGISPVLGLELPTGDRALTSNSWDPRAGLYLSGRGKRWATDLNLFYVANGLLGANQGGINLGDESTVIWAFAYWFSPGLQRRVAYAPVLEVSYRHLAANRAGGNDLVDTGESIMTVSPGIKIAVSSTFLEALIQFPLWQYQRGVQLERSVGGLVGVRLMF